MLAHLITNDALPWWAFITGGFNTDKANQKLIDGLKHLSNEQLLERWARVVVPKWLPAWSPDAYLMDDWVHQQDPARLRLVLTILPRSYKRHMAGLHLVAGDLGWEYGSPGQPEVVGSAEALAMGIANRPAARDRLRGRGVEKLLTAHSMGSGADL